MKLQRAALDRELDAIGKALSEKFKATMGKPEMGGEKAVLGKVKEAIAEYDAYADKMEARIEKNTKKDGQPKAGKEGAIERAERLKEESRIEMEAIKQRAEQSFKDLKERLTGSDKEIAALENVLGQKKRRAETEADIAAYLATEKRMDKIDSFLDTLNFRGDQAIERGMSEGERLGYKKAAAEYRSRALMKRLEDYQKTAGKESFKKATDIEKRIDSRMAELDEYTTKTEERIAEREKFMASYEASVGGKINQAIEDARNEASSTITGWAIEQANLAVLQPSLYTKTLQGMMYEKGSVLGELGSAFMQFKQFPIAMVTQHFMQRSVGTGGTFNIIKYNLELLALTSIFGGMGLIMGDLAQGKDPREIFEDDGTKRLRDFGLQAMLKGGGLGIFGNILQTDFTGRRAFEQIAGPSFSKAMNLARLGEGAFDPKMNFGKAALDVSKDWTPGQNYLFTRAVYHNYLMASLYELAQPGYAGRMRGLAEKNLGTEYFMGYGVEPRAPNFGNIYQDR
jgi:hypothetical protein